MESGLPGDKRNPTVFSQIINIIPKARSQKARAPKIISLLFGPVFSSTSIN